VTRIIRAVWLCAFFFSPVLALSQEIASPEPQTASIVGTVTDVDETPLEGVTAIIDGPTPADHSTVLTNETGLFEFKGLKPAVSYHVTVTAKNFSHWTSSDLVLTPGQRMDLATIKLKIEVADTVVAAASEEQIATEQVELAEQQRILGVIPNFYVVYDPHPVPLTAKLKYKLALRAGTDVVSIAGAAFIAGLYQASDTLDFQQGAKGYAQRFGVVFADDFSDIMIGGAILPSVLHQDPRYFYQGTGTKKSRMLHALESPFVCMGDNGHKQFNYSSVGGDVFSGALSNLYYPASDRGPHLVFENTAITTAGRMANALAQEFIFRKFTTHSQN
jgi:Carboxypeptidase regulatory-like domain